MIISSTHTIYALLIGINNYPNPRHCLQGCLADIAYVHEYLKSFSAARNINLNVLILKDENATREAIIQGFKHFEAAKEEDICLLHYSGHGSRAKSPREFLHLESDGYIESIVCYDSREKGGKDLINKELSWLIWKATKGKANLQFVSIMDCCHSGRVTRGGNDSEDEQPQVRTMNPREDSFKANTLLGFSDFQAMEDGRYTPPTGRQILLAAAREKETAKEVTVKSEKRGIFTYFLLDTLTKTQGQITYEELINRISFHIKNKIKKQLPLLTATISFDKAQYFLTKNSKPKTKVYLAYWHKSTKEWRINAGIIEGIGIGYEKKLPLFKVLESDVLLESSHVYNHYPVIKPLDTFDTSLIYNICQKEIPDLIYFAQDNNTNEFEILRKTFTDTNEWNFELTNNIEAAYYQIIAKDEHWYFLPFSENKTTNTNSLLSKIFSFEITNVRQFLDGIEKYLNWIKILLLNNRDTMLKEEVVELHFYKTLDNTEITANPAMEIVNLANPVTLTYTKKEDKWYAPRFQLNIKNKSRQAIWVSVCWFGVDYSIQNHLVDIQELSPNESVWAFAMDKNSYQNQTIIAEIPEKMIENGIGEGTIYLKVFISKETFNTDGFNQKGIYEKYTPNRFTQEDVIISDDWTTKEISFNIKKI